MRFALISPVLGDIIAAVRGAGLQPPPASGIELERHEAKYLVAPSQVNAIRDFIEPFCTPDAHAEDSERPEYIVTTLQLDTPDMALYRAKDEEQINRFKLRVRTYGTDGRSPVFLEIKRKNRGVIVKSRAALAPEWWNRDVCRRVDPRLRFRSSKEEWNYLQFVRAVRALDAGPVILIRYHRESYMGRNDRYARLTLDRRLCYRPARDWDLLPPGAWWSMDSGTAQNRPFSGLILEMKTYADAPCWMVDLAERFDLVRIGFCKYYTAIRLESLFRGRAYADSSETVEDW
jgi:hypothetical protein